MSQTLPIEQEILLRKYDHVFVNAEDGRDGMKRGEAAHQRGFCLANVCDKELTADVHLGESAGFSNNTRDMKC